MKRLLLPPLLLALLLGAWQVAAQSGALADVLGLEDFLVPSPGEIASSIWEDRSLLAENAWVTLREILLGLALAIGAGVAIALAMHLSETLRLAFYPVLVLSQAIPIVAIAPVLVVWFGFGIWPTLLVIALICFFPIAIATLDGLRSVDREAINMMRTLDASRWQILRRVEAPSALPGFFSGARIAVVIAPIGAVFGEWISPDDGLGSLIFYDNAQLQTSRMFASVAVLAAIALALVGLLALAERRVAGWR